MTFELLLAYGWQGLVLAAWVGLSVGSFLNVVAYRLPIMLERDWQGQAREILEMPADDEASTEKFNLSVPRSRCLHCGHWIRWWENIPVLSWLWLRGKCSNCGKPISWRYPTVEFITGVATLAVLAQFGFTPTGLALCFFTWLLIAMTLVDFDTKLLPDQMTYPLLWLGLFTNAVFTGIVDLQSAVIGAIAGYLFLWSIYWAFKLLTGKEGMGYGDFKLLAALGAWLGWQALPSVILIAAVVGLVYALGNIVLRRQDRHETIPFGPFLAVAGWVTLYFRDTVLGF